MTYHRLTHDILAHFIQASWDLLSELVDEQTPLNGHLPRSEVICSGFLCALLSKDAQGTIGTLGRSFKGKENKSVCGRGGGVSEKHRSKSYANSINKLLPVCVFRVSFKSVWAGWNILWACSLGWQVGVTLQSQGLMRAPVSCSRYALRRDCRTTVSSKYSHPSPLHSHLWHGSQGPGSSDSVLCYLDFLKAPLLLKRMQKLNNLPFFE